MINPEMQALLDLAVVGLRANYQALPAETLFAPAAPLEVMVPMSDGICLRTVCRLPDADGSFPTIVMRSCYPFQDVLYEIHAEEYSKRGFGFVYQFCRGTGGSEGEWIPNVHDRQDGKDTLEWLAGQEWVENIGYWGSSYLAFTGWIVADILPSKVKTLYLTHYGTDRFTSAYQNGLFRQDVLTAWAMENAGFPIEAEYFESLRFRPQVLVDEKLWGQRIDWYRDWITNTNREDPYWQSGFWKQLKEIPGKIKVPVYIGEGWYDHHLGSALITYGDLSPESKAHSTLRVGAWNHGFLPCVEGTLGNHLENNEAQTAFSWFDAILNKKEQVQGKILTYQIGDDRWEQQTAYPFCSQSQREFYFSAKATGEKAYSLIPSPEDQDSKLSYPYDPDNPVMTHGAESVLRTFTEIGSLLQPECGWREDVLSFLSLPLEVDLDILGKIQVKLYVSSSAEDTAFTAKVMEVFPDGRAYNIRSSITTLAYRTGGNVFRMEYTPGMAVEAVIDLWDISWKLHKGSRLRVDISSSDFPQYSVHTNYPGIWSLQGKAKVAEQTLHCGIQFPSRVVLPLAQEDC